MFEKGSRKEGRFERNGGPKYRANLLVRYLTTSAVPYILDLPPPPPPGKGPLFAGVADTFVSLSIYCMFEPFACRTNILTFLSKLLPCFTVTHLVPLRDSQCKA